MLRPRRLFDSPHCRCREDVVEPCESLPIRSQERFARCSASNQTQGDEYILDISGMSALTLEWTEKVWCCYEVSTVSGWNLPKCVEASLTP